MADSSSFNALIDSLNEAPVGAAVEREIPAQNVLAIEGEGHPGSPGFRQGVRDLWRVAYAVQQLPRTGWVPEGFVEFAMPPTEVLFESSVRDCPWRMFFPQPEFVTQAVLDHVRADLEAKDKELVGEVFLAEHAPERVVQSMHVGHPQGQPETTAIIATYAQAHGLTLSTTHHEILIDDPVRIGFETARNLLRYAVVEQ
jgi:hypothetical protein